MKDTKNDIARQNGHLDNVVGYKWLRVNGVAWTQSFMLFPVKVDVHAVDWESKKAYIESDKHDKGWLPFDRLYESESTCPCR